MDQNIRNAAITIIDNYLTYLACANTDLRKFDKSILLAPDLAGLKVLADDPVAYMGATPEDLGFSWCVKTLGRSGINGPKDALFALFENRTVPINEVSQFKS